MSELSALNFIFRIEPHLFTALPWFGFARAMKSVRATAERRDCQPIHARDMNTNHVHASDLHVSACRVLLDAAVAEIGSDATAEIIARLGGSPAVLSKRNAWLSLALVECFVSEVSSRVGEGWIDRAVERATDRAYGSVRARLLRLFVGPGCIPLRARGAAVHSVISLHGRVADQAVFRFLLGPPGHRAARSRCVAPPPVHSRMSDARGPRGARPCPSLLYTGGRRVPTR